jgi:hypothetical protein
MIPSITITSTDGETDCIYQSPTPPIYCRDRLAPPGYTHSQAQANLIIARYRRQQRERSERRIRERAEVIELEDVEWVPREDSKDLPRWGAKTSLMEQARHGISGAYKAVVEIMRDFGSRLKIGKKVDNWWG